MTPEMPLPGLWHNGAVDPDVWRPSTDNLRDGVTGVPVPDVGDLVAWRYAAWRVAEVRPYLDVDLTDRQRVRLDAMVAGLPADQQPIAYLQRRPVHVVLNHTNGPIIIKDGERRAFTRLHDGTTRISFTSWPRRTSWWRLPDPYKTCSCHGHPWPCRDYDQAVLAAHQTREMDRLLATAQPGVCAHCLEVISTRQLSVTFPEESRLVPGAPGPTFHAGRAACWAAAEEYERSGRLVDDPEVPRVASCPGVRLIHEQHQLPAAQRVECTAGPGCTGLHGPSGYHRETPCWLRVQVPGCGDGYLRPGFDCGYRSGERVCLGSVLPGGDAVDGRVAADLLWAGQRGGLRTTTL